MNFEQLRDLVVEVIGCEEEAVSLQARLKEDLKADSLAAVELIMRLEEETGLEIDDEQMGALKTVGELLDYLNRSQG